MNITYITTYDASNILSWSGTPYFIAKTIQEQGFNVNYLGNLEIKNLFWHRLKRYYYKRLFNKVYDFDLDPAVIKRYTHQIYSQLKDLKSDIIFSPSSIPVSSLELDIPVVFFTDASFAGMQDFYPAYKRMCKETKRNGNLMEQNALNNCNLAIYSSEWALKTAKENYQVEQSKLKFLSYGANIDCDRSIKDIEKIVDSRDREVCHLLYIGVDWERKRGEMAIVLAKELNESGIKTDLTIVGESMSKKDKHYPDYIHFTGFINKSEKAGLNQLEQIFTRSHFFVLPSLADCTPMVFPESNSFGIPVITTNVGGQPSVISEGLNGRLFDPNTYVDDAVKCITELFSDFNSYKQLALSSFNEFETRLNWKVVGSKLKTYLLELI